MNSLSIRILSALVGLALLFAVVFFGQVNGVLVLIFAVSLLSAREIFRLLFPTRNLVARGAFFVLSFLLMFTGVYYFQMLAPILAVLFVSGAGLSLWSKNFGDDLKSLFEVQLRFFVGLFYVAVLPVFAARILLFENGMLWFLCLLTIVFVGDSAAYVTGLTLGKTPLLPAVSPKKTREGSAGGLVGSALAALAFFWVTPQVSIFSLLLLGLFVGMIAQTGDLFESQIKRIANQKDSGALMPGHGGVLDRIDGVLFGAPVMYLGLLILQHFA